jgi:hypothetical protein
VQSGKPLASVVTKEGSNYFVKRWLPTTNKETKDKLVWNAKRARFIFTDAKTKQTWEVDKKGVIVVKMGK